MESNCYTGMPKTFTPEIFKSVFEKWLLRYKGSKTHKLLFLALAFVLMLSGFSAAQEPYYFHTIHSHSLSAMGGRTAKVNYTYQVSHSRQFKLSTLYIHDSYNQDRNEIKSDIWNLNLQFQYIVMHQGKFFLNWSFGAGTYYFTAKDLLDITINEWHVDFLTGAQAEIYIVKNTLALTFDYDIIFMPWSDIYEFLHVPNVGISFHFF